MNGIDMPKWTSWTKLRKLPLRRVIVVVAAFGIPFTAGFLQCKGAVAVDFYLSASGDDNNPGTRVQPWKSLEKVNGTHLKAGDRVLLESGESFKGSIILDAATSGAPGHPIIIRSTGKKHATIISSGKSAISAICGGIQIHDLTLVGDATEKDKSDGISFCADDKSGAKYRDISIDNVEISGFGGHGIAFTSADDSKPGYENVRITHANVHDNFGTGIFSFDKFRLGKQTYAHKNLYVGDCVVSNNHSGSGIIISGVDGALVEYCRSTGNDGKGGGVGIWAYAASKVTFQYCIASNTTCNNGGDGGGFDLDGGCVDSIVQYCLTYGNEGPGYMHCDFPWAPPTIRNVIRNSISVDDGRKQKGSHFGFGICCWGAGLDDCTIADNITAVTSGDPEDRGFAAYWVAFIKESDEDLKNNKEVQHINGCVFRNNTASISGAGAAFVANDFPGATPANVLFKGNDFQSTANLPAVFLQGKERYATLAAWRSATNQEPHGAVADSELTITAGDAKELKSITDPRKLPKLKWMKIRRTATSNVQQ